MDNSKATNSEPMIDAVVVRAHGHPHLILTDINGGNIVYFLTYDAFNALIKSIPNYAKSSID
jgi:hypothetical protein